MPLEQGAAWSPGLTEFIFAGEFIFAKQNLPVFLAREDEQVDASAQAVW